jgi:DivIVA domain-containing protein
VSGFELGWRDIADRLEQAAVVEPVDHSTDEYPSQTPDQIRQKAFDEVRRGLKAEQVREYLAVVAKLVDSLERGLPVERDSAGRLRPTPDQIRRRRFATVRRGFDPEAVRLCSGNLSNATLLHRLPVAARVRTELAGPGGCDQCWPRVDVSTKPGQLQWGSRMRRSSVRFSDQLGLLSAGDSTLTEPGYRDRHLHVSDTDPGPEWDDEEPSRRDFWSQFVIACLVAVALGAMIVMEMGGVGLEHRSSVDHAIASLFILGGGIVLVRGIRVRSIVGVAAGLFIAGLGIMNALGIRQCQGDECGGLE